MGTRSSQRATWYTLLFALICAVWAVTSMILFFRALDNPNVPRVPLAILKAINVQKLHEIPGYPRLKTNASGDLDPAAQSENMAMLTQFINPAPLIPPMVVITLLVALPILTLSVAIISVKRDWNTTRRGATIASILLMPLAGLLCLMMHSGLDFRPYKHGGFVRQMESCEALSIAKWNKQVDRGNLPPSARAEHSISWVLYDTSGLTFSASAIYALVLGAASLVLAPLLRWIWRNRWSVKNRERLAQLKT